MKKASKRPTHAATGKNRKPESHDKKNTAHDKKLSPEALAERHGRARFGQARELLAETLVFRFPADQVMERYFKAHKQMGSQDRRFAAETVYGCLRRRRELLVLCAAVADVSTSLKEAHWLLATYLVKVVGWSGRALEDAGFTDDAAALIAAIRAVDVASLPFADRASLPDWLAEPLLAQLGEQDAMACAQALNQPAPVDLRVNTLKTTRDALAATLAEQALPVDILPRVATGLRRHERGPLFNTEAFRSGQFELQDEGSQLIGLLCAARPRQRVVDFCAGAGGKTLQLAAEMNNRGEVIACDVAEWRLQKMRDRLKRAGIDNVRLQPISSEHDVVLHPLVGTADCVLVDAPCSGSGTLRRNPDIKWRPLLQVKGSDNLPEQQLSILTAAAQLVKVAGRLVYATCSLIDAENSAVVNIFLAAQPGFRRATRDEMAVNGVPADVLNGEGDMALLPHRHGTDGFYGAVLIRVS